MTKQLNKTLWCQNAVSHHITGVRTHYLIWQRTHTIGRPVRVEGPQSNMGRLDCKEVSIIAHAILAQCDVEFITVSDSEADNAADTLAMKGLPTTPSGAAGFAGFVKHNAASEMPGDFRPLIIVTETGL